MTISDSRDNTPDIMKGILILCVVFGHSLSMVNSIRSVLWSQSIVNVFFTSFEMPCFSLLSGYFLAYSLEHRTTCQVMKRRLLRYLPVLLIWCAASVIINAVFHQKPIYIKDIFIDISREVSSGKLWYIFSYLFCSILFCIYRIIESKFTKLWTKTIIQVLGCVMLLVFIHISPISFGYSTFLLPFFLVGYIMRTKMNNPAKLRKINKSIAIIGSGLFPILLFFYKADYSFYIYDQHILYVENLTSIIQTMCIFIMRFICALCGCCFVYCCSQTLSEKSNIAQKLSIIGKKSLSIYILSVHLQILLCKIFSIVFSEKMLNDFNVLFSVGVLFFIALLSISEITRKIITHIPIIGKLLLGE